MGEIYSIRLNFFGFQLSKYYKNEDIKEILRRIAERGRKLALEIDPRFVDLFQHLLDEIARLE